MPRRPWILFDIGGVLEVVDDGAWQAAFVRRWQVRAAVEAFLREAGA